MAGTWAVLAHNLPSASGGLMLLLSDGTVMAKSIAGGGGGDSIGNTWYKLTPTSTGSYVNGTWTALAPMVNTRLYFSSQVLKDGRVFVAGGEYGTGGAAGETYDPLTNTWTVAPAQGQTISDANSEILPDGRVLVALVSGTRKDTAIFNPVTNTWTAGPSCINIHNESAWVKLPDDSILMVDLLSTTSERYIPSLNQWVADANVPVALYDGFGSETGSAFLLPDGRAFFIGSPSNTAYYTPSGNASPGSWAAGPTIPGGMGAPDAPAAMMPTGKILLALSPTPFLGTNYPTPTTFWEFDYTTNTFTSLNAPGGGASLGGVPAYVNNMLVLPNGSVLYCRQGQTQFYVYTPAGAPLAAGMPTISSITRNSDGSHHLTGTKLNGISEGASYGDDWQMNSNYPIVRLTSGSNVYYARTYNWSSTGVMTGNTPVTTEFTLPAGLPAGTYSLVTTANGIASDPVTFTSPAALSVSIPANAREGDAPVTGTVTASIAPTSNLMVSLASSNASKATVPASVTILAGQTSATYGVTIVDNALLDGTQNATITATGAGYSNGTGTVAVSDNDVHHLTVAAISSPQAKGVPFSVTITAKDVNGVTIPTYTGTSSLTVSGTAGTVAISPVVTGAFLSGVWTGNVTANAGGTNAVLTANDGAGHTGASNSFNIAPAIPVLSAMPAYTKGTGNTFSWPASTGATGYDAQIAATAGFASPLSTQSAATPSATFTGLASGSTYYYRARANAGTASSAWSNVISSTQDAAAAVIAVTNLAQGVTYTTTHASVTVQGTASDAIAGLSGVKVNGLTATTSDGFAHWSATVPLVNGANTLTVTATDNAQPGGNTGTASISVTRLVSTQSDGLPDSWKTAHGLDPNSADPANGPLGDPAQDGFVNLMKYAFNLDPQSSAVAPYQSFTQVNPADSLRYLMLSYPRRIGAMDLSYAVEISDDLTWPSPTGTTELVSVVADPGGVTETVSVRIKPSVDTAARKFVRIRVTSL